MELKAKLRHNCNFSKVITKIPKERISKIALSINNSSKLTDRPKSSLQNPMNKTQQITSDQEEIHQSFGETGSSNNYEIQQPHTDKKEQ